MKNSLRKFVYFTFINHTTIISRNKNGRRSGILPKFIDNICRKFRVICSWSKMLLYFSVKIGVIKKIVTLSMLSFAFCPNLSVAPPKLFIPKFAFDFSATLNVYLEHKFPHNIFSFIPQISVHKSQVQDFQIAFLSQIYYSH